MTHNETNTSCPQNRCGEWSKCNNGECEGMHDCTCETPIESWEKEFDEKFEVIINLFPEDGQSSLQINLKDFIRTKLEEAYQKGREDTVEYIIKNSWRANPFGLGLYNRITLTELYEQARHAGEVSNQKNMTKEEILERIERAGIEIGFKGNDACVVGSRSDIDPHKLAELLAEIINKD